MKIEREGDTQKVYVDGVLRETVRKGDERYVPIKGSFVKIDDNGLHEPSRRGWVRVRADRDSVFRKLDADSFRKIVYEVRKFRDDLSALRPCFNQHGIDYEQTCKEPASLFMARQLGYVNMRDTVTEQFNHKLQNKVFDSDLVELRRQVQRDRVSLGDLYHQLAFDLRQYLEDTNPTKKFFDVDVDVRKWKEYEGTPETPTLTDVDDKKHVLVENDRIIFPIHQRRFCKIYRTPMIPL